MTLIVAQGGKLTDCKLHEVLGLAAASDYSLLVDDEADSDLLGKIAKKINRVSDIPAIVVSNLSDATELCKERIARLALLDLQFGTNLTAGILWLENRVDGGVAPTTVVALSQYASEPDLVSRLDNLDCFSKLLSKDWPTGVIVDDALEEIGADGRLSVTVLLSGVHRQARWITVVVPAWDPDVHIRVDTWDKTRFRIDLGEFSSKLSDGRLKTLLLSGRADVLADKESKLRLRLDCLQGQLERDPQYVEGV